ncbi:PH domain-containing protein [Saccharopolyspora taberi]|uniref:PH domain-containing protein n=1 Tax=Saccharopolyspora taberi TaxID=60895 RepID=A0ABN3VN74_9PSEU
MQSKVSHQWSTPIGLVSTGWVLAAGAAVWWVLADSATDRVFVTAVLLVLVVVSGFGTLARPRLSADQQGVTVRGLRGRRTWPWSGLTVRLDRSKRLGRTVEVLELDTADDELIVLTKLDLGEDPDQVARTLDELRP